MHGINGRNPVRTISRMAGLLVILLPVRISASPSDADKIWISNRLRCDDTTIVRRFEDTLKLVYGKCAHFGSTIGTKNLSLGF